MSILHKLQKKLSISKKSKKNHPLPENIIRHGGFEKYIRKLAETVSCPVAWGSFDNKSNISDFLKNDILCIETPLIGRHIFNDEQRQHESYFRIAWNDPTSLNGGFIFPEKTTSKRINTILEKTGTTKKKPWRKNGQHILYAMQVPGDVSLKGTDVISSIYFDLFQLKKTTKRKVFITIHPDSWRLKYAEIKKEDIEKLIIFAKSIGYEVAGKDTSSQELLSNCWCVINYSSGLSFEAIMEGIPCIALSTGNFMYPVCAHTLNDIDNPYMPVIQDWLNKLAYTQWNLQEIQDGTVKSYYGCN